MTKYEDIFGRSHSLVADRRSWLIVTSCIARRWRLIEAQAGLGGTDGKAVEGLMQQAAELNITVLRVFATGVTSELPLQLEPGVLTIIMTTCSLGIWSSSLS